MDGLRMLLQTFTRARRHLHSEFYRIAWTPPCDLDRLRDHCRAFFRSIYDPAGELRAYGFKEIRYGSGTYEQLETDLAFFRELFPEALFIFNTRRTETAVKSSWWAANPARSTEALNRSRANFHRYLECHPENAYHMPYEELMHDSPVLEGMFQAVGFEFLPEYERELDVVIR
jgi:hypothetical protein